jgi:hypothetical protein
MAADVSSAVAGDTTDPQGLATIPEDSQYADTANAKEMDANDEEMTENSSKHTKSHILVTTTNSTCTSNTIEEIRALRRVEPAATAFFGVCILICIIFNI